MPLPYSSSALKSTNLKEMVAEARRMQQMEEWKRNGAAESAAKRKQADAAGAALEYAKRGLARSQAPLESRVDISIPDQESGNYRPLENFKDATPADLEQTGVSSDAMGGPEQNVSAVDRKARLATELRKARLQAATTKPADYAPGDAAQTAINIPSPSAQASGYRAPEPVDGSQAAMKDQTREDWKPSGPQTLMAQMANAGTLGNADRIAGLTAFMPGGDGNYSKARARARDTMASGREENPGWAIGGDIAGFLAPGGAVAKLGGKAAAPVVSAASKMASKLGMFGAPVRAAAKIGTAAGIGAVDGALYGSTVGAENEAMAAGKGSPGVLDRLQEGGDMAMWGAGGGAALQAAAPLLRPVGRAAQGAAAGVLDMIPGVSGQLAKHNEKVGTEAVRRSLERAGIVSIDDLVKRAAKYGDKPVVTGELGADPLGSLTSLVRQKGTTGEKAAAVLEDRVAGMPGRMLKDIADETGLPVEAVYGNIERMILEGQARAKPIYNQAMNQNFAETERLQQLAADSPALRQALSAADTRLQNLAAAEGRPVDTMPPLARYDEAKKALDSKIQELIEKPYLQGRGASIMDLEAVRKQLVDELDRISAQANTGQEFPALTSSKYAEARSAGADAPAIDTAFKRGKTMMSDASEEVEREISRLTGQPLTAMQSGVIQNMIKSVENGTLSPGRVRSSGFQKKLRSVFGEEAADGLTRKFGVEAELAQKGSRWNPLVGAVTSGAQMGGPSKAGDEIVKAGINAATGNKIGLITQVISTLRRQGYSENQLNAMGDLLLSSPDDAAKRLFPGQTPKNTPPTIPPAGMVRTNGPAGALPEAPAQPVRAVEPPPAIEAPQASGLKFAAIRYKDANGRMQILRGKDHVEIEAIADKKFARQELDTERGFIGANGKFVSGMDAALDALSAGQITDPKIRAIIEGQIKAGKEPVITSEMLDFNSKKPRQ